MQRKKTTQQKCRRNSKHRHLVLAPRLARAPAMAFAGRQIRGKDVSKAVALGNAARIATFIATCGGQPEDLDGDWWKYVKFRAGAFACLLATPKILVHGRQAASYNADRA